MEVKNKKSLIFKIILVILIIAAIILILLKSCTSKEYKITFDSNGGSKVSSIVVKENSLIEKPTNPKREGYTFVGWYYNKKIYDFNTKVTKNMTLKAKWSKSTTELKLNYSSLTLAPDDIKMLKVTKILAGYDVKDLIWDSSDENIVTVDKDGKLQALKSGTATITVKTKDGKYKTSCIVTVTEETAVTSISIVGATTVNVGSTIKLTVNIEPATANKKVTWKSSNNSIATVDENGTVKGLKEGTVTITVTTENGKTATYKITIKAKSNNTNKPQTNNNSSNSKPNTSSPPASPSIVHVINVSISGSNTMYIGDTKKLTANINPSNASNKDVTWSSNNSEIVSVDGSGNIRANGVGQAIITVKTNDGGKTASITITVSEKPASYAITLTALKELTGIFQYSISVTRNGSAFKDYVAITYNGVTKPFKQYIYTTEVTIDSNIKTASLHLQDGTTINNVPIYYN